MHELFSSHNLEKWVQNRLFDFSFHATVDQIAIVNMTGRLITVHFKPLFRD